MQQPPTHNQPEYTVSEISGAIKGVVEGAFDYVRVRGEISKVTFHANGHIYFDIKDENACLACTVWKSKTSALKYKPEMGLEVILTGKISTYSARSSYQLNVESIEPAGEGALMALLEKRKKELAAKGFFDPARKKKLPFMPSRIGVITSPTGAVIRDILHRIEERFPCHVLVWPVRVQGQTAHCEVADAIKGFNELPENIRPQVLIVARGGGSLEDLWCFNEEAVVYAVVESKIPIISAVGHETDTTLIDFAADLRAPTPTAAAELAVPVLSEWKFTITDYKNRMRQGLTRLVQEKIQRLDERNERLRNALPNLVLKYEKRLAGLKLRPQILLKDINELGKKFQLWLERLHSANLALIERHRQKLEHLGELFASYNYKNVLARGFALVKDEKGKLIKSAANAKGKMQIEFADGMRSVKSDD